MLKKLFFLLCCFALTNSVFAQNISDKVTLKINLETVPTIQEVGFDEPQSYWKVSYKLRVADTENIENALKKAPLITKGSFRRNYLASPENRQFSTQIILNDKIKNLLLSNKPQTFIFEVKWQASSKILKNRLKDLKKNRSQNKNSKKTKLTLKHLVKYTFSANPDKLGGISREGIIAIEVGISGDFGYFSNRIAQ